MITFLPERIVEAKAVDNVLVPFQGEEFLATLSVPDFAGAVVTTRDEFVSIFVEGTISQRLVMSFELLAELEILLFVANCLIFKL
jgi:hypothetical protein